MITEIIKECLEKGILICLILDLSDWETVIIGKVLSFDDKNILINEVNPYGKIIRKKRKIKISQIKVLSHSDIYGKDLDFLHSNALINSSNISLKAVILIFASIVNQILVLMTGRFFVLLPKTPDTGNVGRKKNLT
ncbi:MAG TPA: hypothetical protein PLI34_05430 [Saprospiraceae bacterium]|nr:hypothetical protein [Saprospiraceae bacterium]HRK80802.1 hypothetical protein [Saprospiraceae bacterium]